MDRHSPESLVVTDDTAEMRDGDAREAGEDDPPIAMQEPDSDQALITLD